MEKVISFEDTRIAFEKGTIFDFKNDELLRSLRGLSVKSIANDSVRHQAIIMAHSIQSILLRRLLDEQEKRNSKTTFWFMVLAIGSLSATVISLIAG